MNITNEGWIFRRVKVIGSLGGACVSVLRDGGGGGWKTYIGIFLLPTLYINNYAHGTSDMIDSRISRKITGGGKWCNGERGAQGLTGYYYQ